MRLRSCFKGGSGPFCTIVYFAVKPFLCYNILVIRYYVKQELPFGGAFMENQGNYCIIGCHVLWREICYYAALSKNSFDFKFLKQGLHNTPELLYKELQQAIDGADGKYDAILVGYGLCSRGIEGITSKESRLVFMRGHDCITFFLGSKEFYREYFDMHPGTYWYTPGWIETGTQPGKDRYENTLRTYVGKYGEENAEYLMEMEQGWFKEYSNAAYVDMEFFDDREYKEYSKECAKWLNWSYEELKGSPGLIEAFLAGDWDNDRFLVVEPGYRIAATNGDDIITAVKDEE